MDETTAAPPRRSWGLRILLVLLAAVVVPVGAAVVYTYPPAEYSFYPRCVFHEATGLHCPGCGVTRCVGALVHGDIPQAFAYNPLFMLALPWLALLGLRTAFEAWTGKRLPRYRTPPWTIQALIALLLAFWIARNIDVYPLTLLAPHTI